MRAHFYINDFVTVLGYNAIITEVVVSNQIAYKLVNFSGNYLGWVQEIYIIETGRNSVIKAIKEWYLEHDKNKKRYKELYELLEK